LAAGVVFAASSEAWAGLADRDTGGKRSSQEELLGYYTGVIEFSGGSKAELGHAFYNRGNAFYYLGVLEKAIADYSRAIVLNPDHAETFYNRANSYADLGDHERAIDDYSQAIRLKPNFDAAYYNRANSHLRGGRLLRAVEDYKKAFSLRPGERLYRERIEALGLAE
jgi:tetratricopeptide (TPR) repeat protein